MAWFRVRLTEEEQRVVNEERCCHPNLRIREKMLVLWLLHTGLTRQHAAKAVGVSRATVQRYVAAFRQGGLDGLRQWNLSRPVSEMAAYRELIRASFEKQPATTIAEACERIFQLTGLRRGPSQVRKFLKDLGLKFYRVRAIPVPPKKNLAEHVADQAAFLETKLKPVLAAAQAGEGHVFFVDAAHFVFGTFLCYLWSFTRIFVRAASGRQRFNVLGAWNAVTRHLIAVTNTTVVNTETISELLRKIAALGLTGAITLVLDNARYQHNAAVKALASQLGITLLFLPSYSPNLNLIEPLEVHQTSCPLRPLPSEVRQLSSRHPRNPRRHSDHVRPAAGDADDAQLSAIRRCFTNGRVRYIMQLGKIPPPFRILGEHRRPAIPPRRSAGIEAGHGQADGCPADGLAGDP